MAAVLARPRILRELQQTVGLRKRIVLAARFVSQNAGNQANAGVDDGHRRHLTAVEDVVSYRNFIRLQNVKNALVKPFVSTAYKEQPRLGGQLLHNLLI